MPKMCLKAFLYIKFKGNLQTHKRLTSKLGYTGCLKNVPSWEMAITTFKLIQKSKKLSGLENSGYLLQDQRWALTKKMKPNLATSPKKNG